MKRVRGLYNYVVCDACEKEVLLADCKGWVIRDDTRIRDADLCPECAAEVKIHIRRYDKGAAHLRPILLTASEFDTIIGALEYVLDKEAADDNEETDKVYGKLMEIAEDN